MPHTSSISPQETQQTIQRIKALLPQRPAVIGSTDKIATSVRFGVSDLASLGGALSSYWVCEQSEGDRHLLFACEAGVYLWDGKDVVKKIVGNLIPSKADLGKIQNETLLDVECAFNYYYNKDCLYVLDAICIEGKDVSKYPLSKRLGCIGGSVILPYRQKYRSKDEQSSLEYIILGKEYFKGNDLDRIFKYIQEFTNQEGTPRGFRYMYNNQKRYDDCQGIYFIPESEPYECGVCEYRKVWQWPVITTSKFYASVFEKQDKKPSLKLSTGPIGQKMEYRTVYFSRSSSKQIYDKLRSSANNSVVIECAYDNTNNGEWTFVRLCEDTADADSWRDVCEKLEILSQDITKDKLITELSRHASEDVVCATPNKDSPAQTGTKRPYTVGAHEAADQNELKRRRLVTS